MNVDSPILSIPGISHFSGTSILAEIGNIDNFKSAAKVIKFAGVSPSGYESGTFSAKHSAITKKGSKYLRKTLYQIILPVIRFNPTFNRYFNLKLSQGKSFRCAQGHCIRKLLRVIFHLLKTDQRFDPLLLQWSPLFTISKNESISLYISPYISYYFIKSTWFLYS